MICKEMNPRDGLPNASCLRRCPEPRPGSAGAAAQALFQGKMPSSGVKEFPCWDVRAPRSLPSGRVV